MTGTTDRLAALAAALGLDIPSGDAGALTAGLADRLEQGDDAELWLTIAVLRAELPVSAEVVDARRRLRADGVRAVLTQLARTARPGEVRVATGAVLVDVQHTARTALATGIQRVVRETLRRWADRDLLLVGWDADDLALRELGPQERATAVDGADPVTAADGTRTVLVPWRSTYLLPELAIESERTTRIQALAQFSGNTTGVVGFDCVPLMSAETTAFGMGSAFAGNLRAVAEMDRVATISVAAATEYRGWRAMLAGAGLAGPDVRAVMLPAEVGEVSDDELASARARLAPDGLPLLVCVGSHEPRKNHLAVLHAAESLWRAGREFRLVFVGGNAWRSGEFVHDLELLAAQGRPVSSISRIDDALLWSAYRIATATVFPSFNEGFGLPVAESLAAGTPVVTSAYGSMREIADAGGAILVDPRDDLDIARGIETAMFDDEARSRLLREAAARPERTWEAYADELWRYLVDGIPAEGAVGASTRSA